METKFKVGDKVVLTKPTDGDLDAIMLSNTLDKYNGEVFKVKDISKGTGRYYCKNDNAELFLEESWLTKVEEGIIEEETQVKETKIIDWEQRRWDLASNFYLSPDISTPESAINQADIFIKYYKQTLK